MHYRTLNEDKVSLLGFGAMRLPVNDDDSINEDEAIKMVRLAIDSGVNYVDTAFPYHGGKSEVVIGKALKDGYREKILLADKLPVWFVKEQADVRSLFEKQLDRLDVDRIDYYLIHCLDVDNWKITLDQNVIPALEELKAEGRIGRIGFSFHDHYELFEEIVDYYDWDFCQIQLNYVDIEFQAGMKGLRYAASKGIPVVIMEPLKGGRITDAVPPAIQEIWDQAPVKRSPVEWAFKWVASLPEVMTILSGMSSMEQLEQNLEIFSRDDLARMGEDEKATVDKVGDLYRKLIKYPCTECKYCMPCPSGVAIPRLMRFLNDWIVYEQNPKLKEEYLTWMEQGEHASNCVKCGACEQACPQHLPIMKAMDEVVESFGR